MSKENEIKYTRSDNVLIKETAETLFSVNKSRPTPQSMQYLINKGATEHIIKCAGLSVYGNSKIDDKYIEVAEHYLPSYHELSDNIAKNFGKQIIIFLARDAETPFDDYTLRYPESRCSLMPASRKLWISKGMNDKALAKNFLSQYGLSKDTIYNPNDEFVLIDTGYKKTVLDLLSNAIDRTYDIDVVSLRRLKIRMIESRSEELQLPELKPISRIKSGFEPDINHELFRVTENLPKYLGEFVDLRYDAQSNRAVAVSSNDSQAPECIGDDYINQGDIDPLSAAILQYRVVKAATQNL